MHWKELLIRTAVAARFFSKIAAMKISERYTVDFVFKRSFRANITSLLKKDSFSLAPFPLR